MPVASVRALVADLGRTHAALGGLGQARQLQCELSRLRERFRNEKHAFDTETIQTLRVLSERARQYGESGLVEARQLALSALRDTFGYESLRPGQEPVIANVLSGRDTIGVLPTGAGKSLTYQIPARILGGTSLVVSPLIALMKDQVDALGEVGIRATYLNSTLSSAERSARLAKLRSGEYELLYAAPEGLEASVGQILERLDLRFIAVDEAHCISHWGHDFRPAYRKLKGLKQRFHAPILALTATATEVVTGDIAAQLSMHEPAVFRGSFFRPNLRISAYQKGETLGSTVQAAILRLVRERRGQSGIVYCLSRKKADDLAQALQRSGIRAAAYHAGLENEDRARVQDAFRSDDIEVVTATIAFGMGIDKSNVRYVVHADMPRSIEGYYQEIGRAGRDGLLSDCILFYSWSEVKAYDRFADEQEDETAAERLREQVREMFALAENSSCRHSTLVSYFGESLSPCGQSCDRCSGSDPLADTRVVRERRAAVIPRAVGVSAERVVDQELFEKLRARRRELAEERGVPAYVVFSDATLLEIAARRPTSLGELAVISGVGPTKLSRYGVAVLEVVRQA